jgi:hypothetical protein
MKYIIIPLSKFLGKIINFIGNKILLPIILFLWGIILTTLHTIFIYIPRVIWNFSFKPKQYKFLYDHGKNIYYSPYWRASHQDWVRGYSFECQCFKSFYHYIWGIQMKNK